MEIYIKNNEDLNKSLIATLWAAMIIMYFEAYAHSDTHSLLHTHTLAVKHQQMELEDKLQKQESQFQSVQGR